MALFDFAGQIGEDTLDVVDGVLFQRMSLGLQPFHMSQCLLVELEGFRPGQFFRPLQIAQRFIQVFFQILQRGHGGFFHFQRTGSDFLDAGFTLAQLAHRIQCALQQAVNAQEALAFIRGGFHHGGRFIPAGFLGIEQRLQGRNILR